METRSNLALEHLIREGAASMADARKMLQDKDVEETILEATLELFASHVKQSGKSSPSQA